MAGVAEAAGASDRRRQLGYLCEHDRRNGDDNHLRHPHPAFDDEIHAEVNGLVDEIAERGGQLGGLVQGTVRAAASRSRLDEYPLDITTGPDHINALSGALAGYGKLAREAIDSAEDLEDADTADLFTQVSRAIDKLLWKVEAHTQASE